LSSTLQEVWRAIDHDRERLALAAEATPRNVRQLRVRFQQWLRTLGAPAALVDDLTLAVYEALANVVEHAYQPEDPHPVMRLQAQLDRDQLLITIIDHGCWRTPPSKPGYRGRGLAVMRSLTTELDLRSTTHGTTVQLRVALPSGTDGHTSSEPAASP
jgi:anti-sigma regulatory factor (Ser/Thr protein kinase)